MNAKQAPVRYVVGTGLEETSLHRVKFEERLDLSGISINKRAAMVISQQAIGQ